MRRNVILQHGGFDRLQQSRLRRRPEITGIRRNQHIRRGIFPFRLEPGEQCALIIRDVFDLDPGFLGKRIEHRLDQLLDARGIHHDFLRVQRFYNQQGKQKKNGDRKTA